MPTRHSEHSSKRRFLTAQRRDKVATMMWDDVKDGEWMIRVERREKGTAGKLKLPTMALEIIEQAAPDRGQPLRFFREGKDRVQLIQPTQGGTG